MTTPDFTGQRPNAEQEQIIQSTANYWRMVGNEAIVQAVSRIEEAAKQLIGITGALQGLAFTIYGFSDWQSQIAEGAGPLSGRIVMALFFLPVLFWLMSLFYATRVFVPQIHQNVDLTDVSVSAWLNIQQSYAAIRDAKLRALHKSHFWLIVSFAVLLILLLLLVMLPAAPADSPLEVLLLTPTPGGGGMTP
jgi:hypothetical protein